MSSFLKRTHDCDASHSSPGPNIIAYHSDFTSDKKPKLMSDCALGDVLGAGNMDSGACLEHSSFSSSHSLSSNSIFSSPVQNDCNSPQVPHHDRAPSNDRLDLGMLSPSRVTGTLLPEKETLPEGMLPVMWAQVK